MEKTWEEILDAFIEMESFSCKPSFSKLKNGEWIDKEKSVTWNENAIKKNNEDYQAEVARLNTEKNKRRDEIMQDVYVRILYELGLKNTEKNLKKAAALWEYAYIDGHSYGYNEVICKMDDLLELAKVLIK